MESPLTRSVPGCSVGLCWLCFTLSRLGCQYFQWWLGCLHLPMAHLNQLARWGCLVRDITSWTSEGLRSLSQGLKHKGWLDVLMIEAEMAQGTNSSCLSTDKIRFSANGEKTDVSSWADSGDSPLHLPDQTREQRPLHCWMALEGPESGLECQTSILVSLPAHMRGPTSSGYCDTPTPTTMHAMVLGLLWGPASPSHQARVFELWGGGWPSAGTLDDQAWVVKRASVSPVCTTRVMRLLYLGGEQLKILLRCFANWKYPCDSLAFHLYLPPLHAARILFLLLIVLDSDNASPLASGRRTGWITKTL